MARHSSRRCAASATSSCEDHPGAPHPVVRAAHGDGDARRALHPRLLRCSRTISSAAVDLLNAAEFEQIKARLGPDYRHARPDRDGRAHPRDDGLRGGAFLHRHPRSADSYPEGPRRDIIFSSRNLHGAHLPDVPGERVFNVQPGDIGELRRRRVPVAALRREHRDSAGAGQAADAGVRAGLCGAACADGAGQRCHRLRLQQHRAATRCA